MITAWGTNDRVIAYANTDPVETSTGEVSNWVKGETLWAAVAQYEEPNITSPQAQDQRKRYKLVFRGHYLFNWDVTRFYWLNEQKWLEPLRASVNPGRRGRHRRTTFIVCQDITDLSVDAIPTS